MNNENSEFRCSKCTSASSPYSYEMCSSRCQQYHLQHPSVHSSVQNEPEKDSDWKMSDPSSIPLQVGEQHQSSMIEAEIDSLSQSKVSPGPSDKANSSQSISQNTQQVMCEREEETCDSKKARSDRRDELLQEINKALDRGVSSQDLETFMKVAKNIHLSLPPEIATFLTEAEEFSLQLRKTLKQRSIPMQELQELVNQCKRYKVQTPEMQRATELLTRCQQWTNNVNELRLPTQKQLQTLCFEAVALPVKQPQLSSLQEKHAKVKKWIKNTNQVLNNLKIKDSSPRISLAEIEDLLSEAQYLSFSHPNIEHLEWIREDTQEWRERATMTSEDKSSEFIQPSESPVLITDNTANHKWTECARKLLESEVIQQSLLTELDNEAQAKGIISFLLKDVQKLLKRSCEWRETVRKILVRRDGVYRKELEDLISAGSNIPTDNAPYLAQLRSRLSSPNLLINTEMDNIENEWISEAQSALQLLPRDQPIEDELSMLKKVISDCPSHLRTSEEMLVLMELLRNSKQWNKQCGHIIQENEYSSLQFILEQAKHVFVDLKMFKNLKKRLRTFEWEEEATEALKGEASLLKIHGFWTEGLSLKFENHPVFLELQKVLKENSYWFSHLEAARDQGNYKRLQELYCEAPATFSAEQRSLLRMTTISICNWKQRAQMFLENGGNYHELKSLISEGEMICFNSSELKQLHTIYLKLISWRTQVRSIILVRPVIEEKPEIRVFKKHCVEEEYLLNKTDDLMADMVTALEKAPYVEIPSISYSFPIYHTNKGLSIVLRLKRVIPKVNKQIPVKSSRSVDIKNKKPPKYPRKFEGQEEYCICKTDLSWTDTVMICCECCEEWYHPTCLQVNQPEVEKLEQFICVLCYERAGIRVSKQNKNTVSLAYLESLIAEVNRMNIHIHEAELLGSILNNIQEWIQETNFILSVGIQIDALRDIIENGAEEAPQLIFDTKIMRLLNIYESFPIQRTERNDLLMLLRKRDWVREAFKCIHVEVSLRNVKKLIKDYKEFDGEIEEVAKELQQTFEKINDIHNTIQLLSSKGAEIEDYQKFLSRLEPVFFKMEKIEIIKQKIDSLEQLHIEISDAPTDITYLKDLNDRAKKIGIPSKQTAKVAHLFQAVNNWVGRAGEALESNHDKEEIRQLLKESQEMGIIHYYILQLQEKLEDDLENESMIDFE